MFSRGRIALSIIAVSALAVAGCTPAEENAAESTVESAATAASGAAATAGSEVESEIADDEVTFTDGVVRAKGTDKEMTGIFGLFTNNTDREINVVGFTSDFDGANYELHEVVDGVMQQKPGGFVIPAGETYELAPGGDHMMIMDYMAEIPAGGEVDITIELGDGSTFDVEGLPVRTMNPGDENYNQDGGLMGHESGQTDAPGEMNGEDNGAEGAGEMNGR